MNDSDLREQSESMRRLARGLLYDRGNTDDVVQDAWLVALSKAPREGFSLRAWLAGTVRRMALDRNRSESSRRERERAVARQETLPSHVESTSRIEVLRRVVDGVDALEEPYRETLLLRFFDDLSLKAIAKRQGVPLETVRTRMRRGLEKLREKFDREHRESDGDTRGAFLVALLPMAGEMPWRTALGLTSGSSLATSTGVIGMAKAVQLAVVSVVCMLVVVYGVRALQGSERLEQNSSALTAATFEDAETPSGSVLEEDPEVDGQREALRFDETPRGGDWVVRGRATYGSDEGAAGVSVLLKLFEGRTDSSESSARALQTQRVATNELGEFEWRLKAPTSTVTVVAEAEVPGADCLSDDEQLLPGERAPAGLQPRIYPLDRQLVGRVTDEAGDPLAGVLVATYRGETRTNAEGAFGLRASSANGMVQGRLLLDGFVETRFSARPVGGERIDAGTTVMRAAQSVSGRVVDQAGRPVRGAEVTSGWTGYGKRLSFLTVTTDEEGRFSVSRIDPERVAGLTVRCAGYVRTSHELDGHDFEADSPVEIVLLRGATVRGRVRFADGRPAPDTWLALGFNPRGIPRLDAYADEDGFFEFQNVGEEDRTLWAIRKGYVTAIQKLRVPYDGDTIADFEIVLQSGREVRGRVVDENGEPIAWAMVYLDGRRAHLEGGYVPEYPYTDHEGRFMVSCVPESSYELGVLKRGYSRYEDVLEPEGDLDLQIQLEPVGRLAGRVVDRVTGDPLNEFTVRFLPAELEPGEKGLSGYWVRWGDSGQSFSGTDGYWNADSEKLKLDEWTGIEVSAPGYGTTFVPRVRTAIDPRADDLVIPMGAGAALRGRVVEAETGVGIAEARVRAFNTAYVLEGPRKRKTPFEAFSDANGWFEFPSLPNGAFSLAVDHVDWTLCIDGPFKVEGALVERTIEMDTGATLNGVLLDHEGRPIAGETLELQPLAEVVDERRGTPQTRTDKQGRFRFEGLVAGAYHVRWLQVRGSMTSYRLTHFVELGESEEATLELRPEGRGVLRGQLVVEGDLPERVPLMLMPLADNSHALDRGGRTSHYALRAYGAFAENGAFRFEGLPAGNYSLMVIAPHDLALMGNLQAEVVDGETIDVVLEAELFDPSVRRR